MKAVFVRSGLLILGSALLLGACGNKKINTTPAVTVNNGDTVTIDYRLGRESDDALFASNQGDTLTATPTEFITQYIATTMLINNDAWPFATTLKGKEVGDTVSDIISLEELDTEKYYNEFLVQTIPTRFVESQWVALEEWNVIEMDNQEAVITSIDTERNEVTVDMNLRHTLQPVWYEITVKEIVSR